MSARCTAVLGWLLAACASGEGQSPSAFERGAGEARVVLGPDGFGTLDGQRMPFEAIVLRLRHRTRGLGLDAMHRFVVAVGQQQGVTDEVAVRRMQIDLDRLLQQLDIMEVEQVELLGGVAR
jgi:hypothetical protein